jgi:hypothetical protein
MFEGEEFIDGCPEIISPKLALHHLTEILPSAHCMILLVSLPPFSCISLQMHHCCRDLSVL